MLQLAAALFLAGLAGGFVHCSAMCGPFMLLLAPRPAAGAQSGFARRFSAALLPYQFGRLNIYAALGAVAGGIGGIAARAVELNWLLSAVLLFAAFLFLARAVRLLFPQAEPWRSLRVDLGFGLRWGSGISAAIVPLLSLPMGLRRYGLGLASGFLPCGFLYGALAAAAGSGGALPGAVAMTGFALGTAVSLIAVALIGAGAAQQWRRAATALAAPLFLVNAVTLVALAVKAAS
jgi:sulfite exporter TauE/SafE